MAATDVDAAAARTHFELLHALAREAGTPGVLVLAAYGENPETGARITEYNARFDIGDVDGMTARALAWTVDPHRNVYVGFCIARPDLPASKRGGDADQVAILALCADFDDADAPNWAARLPLPPNYVLESSPARFQCFYLFDAPLSVAEAAPLAAALKLHAHCDHGTVTPSHVWRIPGLLNWPNKKKAGEGRALAPVLSRVAVPPNGRTSAAALRAALPIKPPATPATSPAYNGDSPEFAAFDVPALMARLAPDLAELIEHGAPPGGDRSAAAFRIVCTLRDTHGLTPEQIKKVFAVHSAAWAAKFPTAKALHDDVYRSYRKIPEWVAEMNARYFVTTIGGKVFVCWQDYDHELRRPCLRRLRPVEFEELHRNRRVVVGRNKKTGQDIVRKLARAWLDHPQRRQYMGGVAFAPEGGLPADVLNLWRGFKYAPAPGDWSLLKAHIRDNICNGNADHFNYVIGWLANVAQRLGQRAGTVLVLRGAKGTGKGVFASAFAELFGEHGLQVSNAKHFTGHFNEHLRTALVLFADEAFFAGDKTAEGVLKALVTESYRMSEAKGVDAEQVANRLSILIAGNHDWVVPATRDERRFAVFDVAETRRQDEAYFEAIKAQLQAGGYAAMLHDLLHYDLSAFHIRAVPQTAALVDQKMQTADSAETWLHNALYFGEFVAYDDGAGYLLTAVGLCVPRAKLYGNYLAFCRHTGARYPDKAHVVGRKLRAMLGDALDTKQRHGGARDYQLAALATLREAFARYQGTTSAVLFQDAPDAAPDARPVTAADDDNLEALEPRA